MRSTFMILAGVLTCSVASALPPEGFENFTLLGRGQPSSYYSVSAAHQKPVWRKDFQSLQYYLGLPVGGNYLSAGARASVTPSWGDRDAYFLRWDYVMLKTNSFSFKWMHENWRYISTAKESVGIEYNTFFGFQGHKSGVYGTVGGYYRWLKQSWNDPWWSPMNFNTEDQEGYFVFVFGWQTALGQSGTHYTIDINNRDPYSYFTMDNLAFDLGLNFETNKFIWRIVLGMRTAALTMGSGSISETYATIGIVSY